MSRGDYINDDVVMACADLVGRAGAAGFELGYLHDDVPVQDAGWYATAFYQGARITVADQPSPSAAAFGLGERLLRGATCRCSRRVTLTGAVDGCRWRLVGARWEPGCDAAPLTVDGPRGDLTAIEHALTNRAARRKRGHR